MISPRSKKTSSPDIESSSAEEADTSRGIVTSLYYLTKAANANNLNEIKNILKETIFKISAWINIHLPPERRVEADSSLYEAMHFMYLFCCASKERRAEIVQELQQEQIEPSIALAMETLNDVRRETYGQ